MKASSKLALYGAGLAAVFAATAAIGGAMGPVGMSNATPPAEHATMASDGTDAGLPGLSTASDGFTIVPSTATIVAGEPTTYSFRIQDTEAVVTEFELEHTKPMHLIVVRRDFVGFVHTHPTMAADGTWSATLALDDPGAYRVFADFVVDGDKHTLGTDLFVGGDFQPVPLPAVDATADAGDGFEVQVSGEVVAGVESTLEFTVRRDGTSVTDLHDYLGAKGHLVVLREGDLAYLHVHADEDRLMFDAEFPSAGHYRMFLQFEAAGAVRTAAFTVIAEEATS